MRSARVLLAPLFAALAILWSAGASAGDLPEYRLKAAFVYNFALFTEWPAEIGGTINVCVLGKDPFGDEIDPLQGKPVGHRTIAIQRKPAPEALKGCQVVFFPAATMSSVPKALETLRGTPVLTIADTPGALAQGIALNMNLVQNKVTFEANLEAARGSRLTLSSKLLRLATEVKQ